MTLMLPKLIDDLEGRIPNSKLVVIPKQPELIQQLVQLLRASEKFDFGVLHLEPTGEVTLPVKAAIYKVPKLTEDELGFLREGLVPLPADVCWYECLIGRFRTGFLIVNDPATGWQVMRMDYASDGRGAVDGCFLYRVDGAFQIAGPEFYLKKIAPNIQNMYYTANMEIVEYLTLMIGSASTERYIDPAPERLNKHRREKDREPLPAHTVITIVPMKYRVQAPGDSTHASPRLHWRRSHIRTLDRELPTQRRILIPRCLVGRAELGEVTHEYRVPTSDGQHPIIRGGDRR